MYDIKTIKQRADITEVISDFLTVSKKGVAFVGICPFHNDTTPSLYIKPETQTYTCFVCGAHGDVFEFVKEYNKCSFPEAVKYVANKYGIDITPDYTPEVKARVEKRNSELNELAKTEFIFKSQLQKNKAAFDYITINRGFTKEIIEKFGIGYAENGFFAKRITFPYFNYNSNVVGFSGRILVDSKDKEVSKYKNTSGTDLYKKGELLFGFIQARRAIAKFNHAYFVEGPTDVMMFHQRGIENTIAGSGTALTSEQAKKIRSICDDIILIYDGDAAGQNAALRNIKILLPTGLNVYVVSLPEGEDPDSFAKNNKKEKVLAFLQKNKISWIKYFENSRSEKLKDEQQKSNVLEEFIDLVMQINDPIKKQEVVQTFCYDTLIDFSLVKTKLSNAKIESSENDKLFLGLKFSENAIKTENEAIICENKDHLIILYSAGYENAIATPSDLSDIEQQSKLLKKLCNNVILTSHPFYDLEDNKDEILAENFIKSNLCKIGMALFNKSFDVKIEVETNKALPFINIYATAKTKTHNYIYSDAKQKALVEEMAELISIMDETLQTLKIPEICKILGIKKEGDFKKVIKPFSAKHKSKIRQINEKVVIDDVTHIFDINNLPEYVDEMFFRKYRFFEAQNKNGDAIFYVFQTPENTLMKVGNFHMKPLFHVYNEDSQKNKRILSVRHESYTTSKFIEIKSADMLNFLKFKEFMFNLGGYLFTNGKPFHYEKILESTALDYPRCIELGVYGLHPDGFYAFPNGILTQDNLFSPVNDLGLVQYKTETYYSPSFSKIWEDSERFDTIKMFAYEESEVTFDKWAELISKVYKYNNNGMWAIITVMLASNREFIFNIDRLFTTLFFLGPTDSGKSQIAISIRSVFIREAAPLFNLTSGTDAAFFSLMSSYKDVAIVLEEYNDVTVSENKFQGLKASIYDGEGKTKRADATSETLVTTMVFVMPILLGQQSPERDDNALSNRVVMRMVPKKDDWTVEEELVYKELKKYEKKGLSNVLVEILKCKKDIHKHYPGALKLVRNELRDYMRNNAMPYQTRIINTVSLFLAMVKVTSLHLQTIKLPFSYDEFFMECVDQVAKQSHDVASTNSLSLFFGTVQSLINNKKVVRGRDFDIVIESSVTVTDENKSLQPVFLKPIKVIYLRVKQIHPEYAAFMKKDYMKMNQLNVNLHDHKAWIGNCKAHRFQWTEIVNQFSPMENRVMPVSIKKEQNTSCVVLNYEILRETADVDFEENIIGIETKAEFNPNEPPSYNGGTPPPDIQEPQLF